MGVDVDVGHLPTLYTGQQTGVQRFLAGTRPRRHVFAWGTGCGKTAGAWTIISRLGAARVLIVTPAIVRRHWLAEAAKWAPHRAADAATIEYGRSRKLSTGQSIARHEAYSAPIQIVSYDLVGNVDQSGWDLIVLDELHHIAAPLAKQSERVADLLAANKRADVLGLSATLIPTEAYQLWNPLRLLFGEVAWGRPDARGEVSWKFKAHYCNLETSEYGTSAWGCREDRRAELRGRLSKVAHVLTRADINAELPPLDLHTLELPALRSGMDTHIQQVRRLSEWADELGEDSTHIVILVHRRDLARDICTHIREHSLALRNHALRYIDGTVPTGVRVARLDECAALDRVILVGTHESLSEGIRLMWAQQVAIDEWSQSPGRALQLLGRFSSVGSQARPCVNLITDPSTYGAAQQLVYRTRTLQELVSAGKPADQLLAALNEPTSELTEENLRTGWAELFDSANLDAHRDAWDTDEVAS